MNHESHAADDFVFVCPARLDCVLAAAGVDEFAELSAWCEQLPADSYGKVFVEADAGEQIRSLATPTGVSVTWIVRGTTGPELRGYALAEAVDAWLDEWVRVDSESERHLTMYAGTCGSEAMRTYWHRLDAEFAAA